MTSTIPEQRETSLADDEPNAAAPAAALDPAGFDVAAWIAGIRTERTVKLYPPDQDLADRVAYLEQQLALMERSGDTDLGLLDDSPADLLTELRELRAGYEASALHVVVRELGDEEIRAIGAEARDAGDGDRAGQWVISRATVRPHFTVEELAELQSRGRNGAALYGQLAVATVEQWKVAPTPPFSRASSTSHGGEASSGS